MQSWCLDEAVQGPNKDHAEEVSDKPFFIGITCFLPDPLALSLLKGNEVHGELASHSKWCEEAFS